MKPLLTIMTGPQGAGNHLFSKALGQNPNIYCWPALQNEYWIGHDKEPFAKYWKDTKSLGEFNWTQSDHFVTSISCPYFDDGIESIPKYHGFIKEASRYADVQLLILGRDQTILKHQQERVRSKSTISTFLESLPSLIELYKITFASQEMLYLYGLTYLNYIEAQLGIYNYQCTQDDCMLQQILAKDANEKYISSISENWLDSHIIKASSKS